jgi:hypothetical protein
MAYKYEIIDVVVTAAAGKTGKKPYQVAEVTYRDDSGKPNVQKIMSFVKPAVFEVASHLKKGDVVWVEKQKNEGGYWQWENISFGGQGESTANASPVHNSNPTVNSYQADYDKKQELIVRQTALKASVDYHNVDVNRPEQEVIVETADYFYNWVMNGTHLEKHSED